MEIPNLQPGAAVRGKPPATRPPASEGPVDRVCEPRPAVPLAGLLVALRGSAMAASAMVAVYREQAQARLSPDAPPGSTDLLALELLERDLGRAPTTLTMLDPEPLLPMELPPCQPPVGRAAAVPQDPIATMADCPGYRTSLTIALGGSSAHLLASPVMRLLERVDATRLIEIKDGGWRIGNLSEVAQATGELDRVELAGGVTVEGAWNRQEVAVLESAFDRMRALSPSSRPLLERVFVRTFIEADLAGPTTGLFSRDRPGELHILRSRLADPEAAAHTVFHEAGHELDRRLGSPSEQPDSPFGRGDYVSEYAATNAREDFAETHTDLLLNWERYRDQPEVYLNAATPVGQKRRFILERGYGLRAAATSRAITA